MGTGFPPARSPGVVLSRGSKLRRAETGRTRKFSAETPSRQRHACPDSYPHTNPALANRRKGNNVMVPPAERSRERRGREGPDRVGRDEGCGGQVRAASKLISTAVRLRSSLSG